MGHGGLMDCIGAAWWSEEMLSKEMGRGAWLGWGPVQNFAA